MGTALSFSTRYLNAVCHGLKEYGNWGRLRHLVGHGNRTYHRCFGGILKQTFDIYAVLGIMLIISGTLLITSKSAVVFQ